MALEPPGLVTTTNLRLCG